MTGDLRGLVDDSGGLVDLSGVPTTCDVCPDAATHGRLYVAGRAHDAEDARHLLAILGLVESPAPPASRRDEWGRAKKDRSTNTNHH